MYKFLGFLHFVSHNNLQTSPQTLCSPTNLSYYTCLYTSISLWLLVPVSHLHVSLSLSILFWSLYHDMSHPVCLHAHKLTHPERSVHLGIWVCNTSNFGVANHQQSNGAIRSSLATLCDNIQRQSFTCYKVGCLCQMVAIEPITCRLSLQCLVYRINPAHSSCSSQTNTSFYVSLKAGF